MTERDVARALRELVPLEPDQAESAWRLYLASEGPERAGTADLLDVLLWQAVTKDYREQLWLPPPTPEICIGEYSLGTVLYPGRTGYAPMGLREADWIRHVLIVGATGSGKTNLAFHLVRLLRRAGKPLLIFDWKQNYRDLRQLPDCHDITVYTVGRSIRPWTWNPLLPPPRCSVGEWLVALCDVLNHAYLGGHGVENLMRKALVAVYDHTGWLDSTKTRRVPTFVQVREELKRRRLSGREGLWQSSALRILDSLCFPYGLGPVLNGPGLPLVSLQQETVVLELDALSDNDKAFVTEAVALWWYLFRKRHARREVFGHALLIEEAHHILSAAKERAAGAETIMETCLRQIREFGEAVIVIDQEPSKLSHSIRANTGTKISFALGTGTDVATMAGTLGLDAETAPWLHRLGIGEGIVALRPRVPVPLHVAFPAVPLRKGRISDAELAS